MDAQAGGPTADELQKIDNVLADTGTSSHTRRSLLGRAAVGAAGMTAVGAFGPLSSALASSGDSVKTVGTTAVTAEALAVTFLTEVVHRAPGSAVESAANIIKAANAEEQAHYRVLRKSGFKPLTTKFWLPDAIFANNMKDIPAVIEVAETLFVNAYLIGITTFAQHHKVKFARYAGEILGVEAEHRALARSLQNKLPNNLAYESFHHRHMSQIVGQLEKVGIGFGKEGAKPGRFYQFRGAGNAVVPIGNPRPA
jgi:ferritin-like protein